MLCPKLTDGENVAAVHTPHRAVDDDGGDTVGQKRHALRLAPRLDNELAPKPERDGVAAHDDEVHRAEGDAQRDPSPAHDILCLGGGGGVERRGAPLRVHRGDGADVVDGLARDVAGLGVGCLLLGGESPDRGKEPAHGREDERNERDEDEGEDVVGAEADGVARDEHRERADDGGAVL